MFIVSNCFVKCLRFFSSSCKSLVFCVPFVSIQVYSLLVPLDCLIQQIIGTNSWNSCSFKFQGNIYPPMLMLRAILNKSWWQHPTKQQLYGHLPLIMKTLKVRQTRHSGHCWRSKDELINVVLLWTPSHEQAKARWPARTYIQQLCADMGCNPEDLPEAMDYSDGWQERVRDIRANGVMWWWCWMDMHRSLNTRFLILIIHNATKLTINNYTIQLSPAQTIDNITSSE